MNSLKWVITLHLEESLPLSPISNPKNKLNSRENSITIISTVSIKLKESIQTN